VDGSNPYLYTRGNSAYYSDPLGLETKEEWQKIALKNAEMTEDDIKKFDYRNGWEEENRDYLKKIYKNWYRLYMKSQDKFLWSGAVSAAKDVVIYQLKLYSKRMADESRGFVGNFISVQFQINLAKGANDIFNDLAWVHEAYLSGGLKELKERINAKELDEGIYSAFEKIENGDVLGGNKDLLFREQKELVQKLFDSKGKQSDLVLSEMNKNSKNPIEGKSFLEAGYTDIRIFEQRFKWEWEDVIKPFVTKTKDERDKILKEILKKNKEPTKEEVDDKLFQK